MSACVDEYLTAERGDLVGPNPSPLSDDFSRLDGLLACGGGDDKGLAFSVGAPTLHNTDGFRKKIIMCILLQHQTVYTMHTHNYITARPGGVGGEVVRGSSSEEGGDLTWANSLVVGDGYSDDDVALVRSLGDASRLPVLSMERGGSSWRLFNSLRIESAEISSCGIGEHGERTEIWWAQCE